MTDSPFVQRLLVAVPELGAVYDAHLRNYDELLPHVFMGDVTRTVVEQCVADGPSQNRKRLMEFFERELSCNSNEAADLIHLGFCENLLGERHAQNVLAHDMGPLVFAAMKRTIAG